MTDEELAAIEARAEKAALGPWSWGGDYPEGTCPHGNEWTGHGPDLVSDDGTEVVSAYGYDAWGINVNDADADFIAAARTDVPALVVALRECREAAMGALIAMGRIVVGWERGQMPTFAHQLWKAMPPLQKALGLPVSTEPPYADRPGEDPTW